MGVDQSLIDLLQPVPLSGRRRIYRVATLVKVVVDCHGRPDGPVRDAVIRGVVATDEATEIAASSSIAAG